MCLSKSCWKVGCRAPSAANATWSEGRQCALDVDVVRLAGLQAEDLEADVEQHVQQLHVGNVRIAAPQPNHGVLEPDVGRIPLPCDRLLQQHTQAPSLLPL